MEYKKSTKYDTCYYVGKDAEVSTSMAKNRFKVPKNGGRFAKISKKNYFHITF